MTSYISLDQVKDLITLNFVRSRKIETIKLLRAITGEGLKETKEFCEQVLLPTLEKQDLNYDANGMDVGDPPSVVDPPEEENLDPPMFLVGHSYKQLDGNVVVILGTANRNTSYETVYSMGSDGRIIHRYNRRDFGRCTGTDHQNPDPRNLEKF